MHFIAKDYGVLPDDVQRHMSPTWYHRWRALAAVMATPRPEPTGPANRVSTDLRILRPDGTLPLEDELD